jgi:tetratricopeptide (TPR) repeat protein
MSEEVAKGTVDLNRGMVYQSAKLDDQAIGYYRLALQRNPENHQARARLADVLASNKRYADIVALFSQVPISKEDGEGAVVQYAESLAETGDTQRAIATLESALKWGANSKPVYLSLANAYRKSGNTARAEELVRQSEAAAVAR